MKACAPYLIFVLAVALLALACWLVPVLEGDANPESFAPLVAPGIEDVP